jgi:hypothetical protein
MCNDHEAIVSIHTKCNQLDCSAISHWISQLTPASQAVVESLWQHTSMLRQVGKAAMLPLRWCAVSAGAVLMMLHFVTCKQQERQKFNRLSQACGGSSSGVAQAQQVQTQPQ